MEVQAERHERRKWVARSNSARKTGSAGIYLRRHPQMLGALTGKQEGDRW